MVEIDKSVRINFYKERLVRLQEALLQMEIDEKNAKEDLEKLQALKVEAGEEVTRLRTDLTRLLAEEEEKKDVQQSA